MSDLNNNYVCSIYELVLVKQTCKKKDQGQHPKARLNFGLELFLAGHANFDFHQCSVFTEN